MRGLQTFNFCDPENGKKDSKIMASSPVITINNVSDYCNEHSGDIPVDKMPTLNLPFEACWMEYNASGPDRKGGMQSYGFACYRIKNGAMEGYKVDDEDCEFVIWSRLYIRATWIKTKNNIAGPFCLYILHLDKKGKILRFMPVMPSYTQQRTDWFDDDWLKWCARIFTPVVFAMGFMNCRNVELIDNEPIPLTKKEKRRGDPERVAYKTIKVLPMRKVYQNANQPIDDSMPEPSTEPLHICRGHFKDFRNGAGLFGKYKDVFWWEQHVRGNAENGTIIKDYEVEAPKSA